MSDAETVRIEAEETRLVSGTPSMIGKILLGRYEVIEVLGEGGMGIVYKAKHVELNRFVAIKVVRDSLGDNETAKARFKREAEAASSFNHPNLCTVHDYGFTDEGLQALVMDYVEGKSLAEIIKAEGKVESSRLVPLVVQLCGGLSHAHRKGVVHRDLKPSNIMIVRCHDGKEQAKIVDFGIAKQVKSEGQSMTGTGEIFGSPYYMSPEQCQGDPIDGRSDLYSLGCLMFEALTGKPPFAGETPIQTVAKHLTAEPPRMVAVSDQLNDIVRKLMAKDPAARYQTAEELSKALDTPTVAPSTEFVFINKLPKRRKGIQVWLFLGVCVIATAGHGMLFPDKPKKPEAAQNYTAEVVKIAKNHDARQTLKKYRKILDDIDDADDSTIRSNIAALQIIHTYEAEHNKGSEDLDKSSELLERCRDLLRGNDQEDKSTD